MKALVNWILGRKEEEVEETVTYLNQRLRTCDRFGKEVWQNMLELRPEQRELAGRLIPALMELGSSSYPPQDLTPFFQLTNWPGHSQEFRSLIASWWQILRHCSASHHLADRTATNCCPIGRNNLPAARAVVWLHMHLQGAAIVPDLLSFMEDCVQQYPDCSETAEQLALGAAHALIRTPYYRRYQLELGLTHPALTRGRLGQRLQVPQMKWAS